MTKPPMPKHYPCGAALLEDEPTGYVAWFAWTEQKSKTHKQEQCSKCGLWHIWVPKQKQEEDNGS